jgi:tyrosine-protein kinase Etk/Wzc
MEEQIQISKTEVSSLTLRDLFYKYIRFLPLFIISIALSLLVAYLYLRYATLVFSATGTMVVQDQKSGGGSNDKFEQILETDNSKNIQNEIEYIKSRQLMNRVVKALNLNFTYTAVGKIKELNIYKSSPFTLEPFKINDSSSFTLQIDFQNNNNFKINGNGPFTFGQVFENQYGVFRLNKTTSGDIANKYKVTWQPTLAVASGLSEISVVPKQNTGILILSMQSTNPQLASDIINQVMVEYGRATIEDKNASTQGRLTFIDKEKEIIEKQIDSIYNQEIQFMKNNRIFDPEVQSSNYFSQIEKAKEESKIQRTNLVNVHQITSYIQNKKGDVPVPSSLGLTDPTLNQMVNAYNQAQVELKALYNTAPNGNAIVKQKEELVDKLQKNILENLNNLKSAYTAAIGSVEGFGGAAQSQLNLMPEKQKALTEIRRQLQGKLVIYNTLLEKREESAMALASTISNIKILTEATTNPFPIKPNRRSIQLLALLIGFLLPGLFIFLLEVLNDKVSTRNDIERLTPTPIIGEVGHSFKESNLVVASNNRGVVAEQFRIVRSNLQYILNHIPKPVILVTSSFSGEGKSFVSINVGAVMALAGKKTIILEFDIRKPKILTQLDIAKRPGLTNYLLGKKLLDELVVKVEGRDNLYVLPCGPVPPNPAELLLDPKLEELFDYLRQNFDVVVMDTAPVGMVSDAMTLSKFSNCTLYIVRQGHTYKRQIGLIDDFNREGKLPRVSIILNDVKVRTGYGYYGYGKYGYGYGYTSESSYFEEETPPPGVFEKWFGWMDTKNWRKKKRKKTKVG